MAIYNLFDYDKMQPRGPMQKQIQPSLFEDCSESLFSEACQGNSMPQDQEKSSFFSALAARLFFLFLLVANIFWGALNITLFCLYILGNTCCLFKSQLLQKKLQKSTLNIKRFLVCSIALTVALVSPALGIMFSCMYFLMYDKKGVEQIVPTSLQDQFRSLFPFDLQ
jgi:hypothetical protein